MRASPSRGRMFAPMRSAAVSAISFALLACGGETSSQSTPKDAGGQGGTGGTVSTGGTGGTVSTGGTGGTVACTPADYDAAKQAVADLIGQKAACFSGYIDFGPPMQVSPSAYGYGGYLSLRACSSAQGQAALSGLGKQLTDALAGNLPACLPPAYSVSIQGGAQSDIQKMADAIQAACGSLINMNSQFTIVLDASGHVVQVNADPSAAALADCVKKALTGLTFPCLASFEVCPEYVIAE